VKTYGGMGIQIHVFVSPELGGVEWSASQPGRFTHGTLWIEGWVGPRTGLDDVENRNIFALHRDWNFGPSVAQPVASRYTDWAIPAPHIEAIHGWIVHLMFHSLVVGESAGSLIRKNVHFVCEGALRS
jgi:hypothetical protein